MIQNTTVEFYSYKRVETLGDIESYLGDDTAAEQHYERALALSTSYRETWADTELRLKLAWCALRKQRCEQARAHIDAALAQCELGRGEHGGSRSLNYVHGLALATLADLYLHQLDVDSALIVARDATKMASRLGQSYGEKARLYTYLAWQLYLHGETAEARALARRAWAALDQWVPIESTQTQAMRTTLTTVLGGQHQRPRSTLTMTLPPFATMVATALDAARKMESWSEQAWALHTLAPYLKPGQLQPPFDDIIVWGEEDRRFFAPYRILLEADFALAMEGPRKRVASIVKALVRLEPNAFGILANEPLYAETLLRLRDQVEPHLREVIVHRVETCAATWGDQLGSSGDEHLCGPVEGLTVLLSDVQEQTKSKLVGQIEACLLKQLQGQTYSSSVFLAALPTLARLGAGAAVVEAIVKAQPRSPRMWIACLAHAVALNLDELRGWIVETVLGNLKRSAPYGSTTEIAEIICHLAPYLQGDEIHQALTLATPVRAIVPRVRALVAVAAALQSEEREAVLVPAWQAASRSKHADTIGEALTTIVVHVAASNRV